MQMDPKRVKPVQLTPCHSQNSPESPFPTSLSPLGHSPSYPHKCSSNTSSTTTSGSRSPLQSPHSQTSASSPSSLHPIVDIDESRSPNQFPHHLPSNLKLPDQLLSNWVPLDPQKKPTLHQKTSPVLLPPPRFSSNQSSPSHFCSGSAGLMSPGPSPPTGFPTSPGLRQPPRLSPNQSPSKQLPHPSQLPPNQWPTRISFSDQGSPPSITPSPISNPSPINMPSSIQDQDTNTIRRSTQSNPVSPLSALTATPRVRSKSQSTPFQGPGSSQGTSAPPLSYGITGGSNENPLINSYAAQIGRYFNDQPILLVEFLLLLKRLNVGKIEANQFVERMARLLDGRMDLLMELGAFVRPQHQHLIYAKVEAMTLAQQNINGADLMPQVYRSPTVDYLTKVCEEVDAETWKLLHIVLERYYSNLNDLLIQKEAISQLEHILKDYPDLQRKCEMLL